MTREDAEKSKTEESSPLEEPERDDQEFQSWKNWIDRDKEEKIERNRKVEKAARLKESCAFQIECTRILSENHTRWLERRKEEIERREKLERLEKVALLKKKIVTKKKKETKKEMERRKE